MQIKVQKMPKISISRNPVNCSIVPISLHPLGMCPRPVGVKFLSLSTKTIKTNQNQTRKEQ